MENLLKREQEIINEEKYLNDQMKEIKNKLLKLREEKELILENKITFLLNKNNGKLPVVEWDDDLDDLQMKEEGIINFKNKEDMILLQNILNHRPKRFFYEIYNGEFLGEGKYKIKFKKEYRCGDYDHVYTFVKES